MLLRSVEANAVANWPDVPITLGRPVRKCEVGEFVVTEDMHLPNSTLPRHSHQLANICFVLKGSFAESFPRSAFHCNPRSIILKPPGEPHRNRYGDQGAHCLIIEIKKNLLGASPNLSSLFGSVSHLECNSTTVAPSRMLRELRIMDTASVLSIEGLAFELMGEMLREKQRRGGPIEPACLHAASEFLHDNFSKPIRLRDVAGAAGVHPAHLAKLFRRFRCCSVGEYLRLLRLRWALRAISASRSPIAQIALEAGFCDQAHFSNVCKRITGISPTRVRAEGEMRWSLDPKMISNCHVVKHKL
jgi:AraC family transcriptional regulator